MPRVLGVRELKIDAIATMHGNDDWKQKSAHRGKLHKEQLDALRDSFDNELKSMCKQQTARVTTELKSNASKARRNCATVPAVMSAVRSSPPRDRAQVGPGQVRRHRDGALARRRQRSAERPVERTLHSNSVSLCQDVRFQNIPLCVGIEYVLHF